MDYFVEKHRPNRKKRLITDRAYLQEIIIYGTIKEGIKALLQLDINFVREMKKELN